MKKFIYPKLALFGLFVIAVLFMQANSLYAQEEREDDPRTWKYFRISARTTDDSIFYNLQEELVIEPKLESYAVTVNVMDPNPQNQSVIIGDETSPDALRYSFSQLTKATQDGLINWTGTNKVNLNPRRLNYGSVFLDAIKKIKIKELIAPPQKTREIVNTTAYINPYLQAFGGDPLGIPIKRGFGFSFYMGTPYTGPLETDKIGGNFHLLGASVGVSTRIKEFVAKRSQGATLGETESTFGNYNNLFTPKLGLEVSYVVPFGNFFQVGYYTVLDSGDYDAPVKVPVKGDTTFMKNHIVSNESFFNWEFRYPFRTFGSTRAKVYVASYMGEYHAGFLGREMRLAGSVFDVRINATFGNRRNFQLLLETMISDIGEGFSLTAFAFGPSVRLTKGPSGNFGVVTVMINARFKIGDFYEER
ncbi:MAG: hypothetical protein JW917_01815 [Ignavibacteria bacterium]|nr:hypothetical protein [Ignavibacteria bacterium]